MIAILIFGSYSAYALWDNNQIYSEASNVQLQMQELKPVIDDSEESGGPTFGQLLAINPDVRGWVTLDGTQIDFPILQGETNLSYINTDVYGKFALAGSIFLDCQNSPDFSDHYNLIYGHHMANSNMFGDLDLYREEAFFRENTTGLLMTTNGVYALKVVALLIVSASDENIFDIAQNQNPEDVIQFCRQSATYCSDDMPEPGDNLQFLAFSTCSSDFTDARTVLITQMIQKTKALLGGDLG
ncbi:MAG: class B sortase [Bacteroidales bacterium]|nr:class B sortase [Bacteroidales bacterium]